MAFRRQRGRRAQQRQLQLQTQRDPKAEAAQG
jgi:hypothetical protein